VHRFCRALIRFRLAHPAFLRSEFYTGGDPDEDRIPDVAWFDADGSPHDWSAASRHLAMYIDGSAALGRATAPTLGDERDDNDFYLMLNADLDDAVFTVAPVPPGCASWRCAVDTARQAPDDLAEPGGEPPLAGPTCRVRGRSLVVLLSR
jgi:glycogen operon protein